MDRRNNIFVFLALSVICTILIISSTINDGWMVPIRTGVGYVLTPLQSGVNKVGSALYLAAMDKNSMDELREENARLQATIDTLVQENTRLEQESFELVRLRNLYKLDREYAKYETVGARIIAKDSVGWFDVFRINKGSDDGIKADMNVLAGGGLVGIVTDVGSNYATVRSIIDDSSRVASMSMRTNDQLIVAGNLQTYDEGRLLLSDIPFDADIRDGDKIVTSNVSSKFLPGILIGFAADITVDSNNLTRSGYLIPVATFDSLQEVLVITQLKEE